MAIRSLALATLVAAVLAAGPLAAGPTIDGVPVEVSVSEAHGKVGQPTVLTARLTIREGYEFIEPPPRGNRVIELSSADKGVEFARRVFRGKLEDNAITFRLEVTPTRPGAHPINGVFRVSYVVHTDTEHHLRHVSLPLISTVVGTE
jgi:hypothetical protein